MGRRGIVILTILGTALAAGACRPGTAAPTGVAPTGEATVQVVKITDGDTLHVLYRGQDEPVRLIGIDTPEVPWYGGRGECFGVEAGLYARGRLTGKSIRLEFDVRRRDRYDRLLAYVYLGDELFNLTLVREGYATAYPVAPDTRLAAGFEQAEGAARAAGRGLWGACPTA